MYDAARRARPGAFDLVFTGIGAICWLPDIRRWAAVVAACCSRAGGCSSGRDTRCCGRSTTRAPTGCSPSSTRTSSARSRFVWDEPGTYVETDVEFAHNVTHEWNHGLGEIVTALLTPD